MREFSNNNNNINNNNNDNSNNIDNNNNDNNNYDNNNDNNNNTQIAAISVATIDHAPTIIGGDAYICIFTAPGSVINHAIVHLGLIKCK